MRGRVHGAVYFGTQNLGVFLRTEMSGKAMKDVLMSHVTHSKGKEAVVRAEEREAGSQQYETRGLVNLC